MDPWLSTSARRGEVLLGFDSRDAKETRGGIRRRPCARTNLSRLPSTWAATGHCTGSKTSTRARRHRDSSPPWPPLDGRRSRPTRPPWRPFECPELSAEHIRHRSDTWSSNPPPPIPRTYTLYLSGHFSFLACLGFFRVPPRPPLQSATSSLPLPSPHPVPDAQPGLCLARPLRRLHLRPRLAAKSQHSAICTGCVACAGLSRRVVMAPARADYFSKSHANFLVTGRRPRAHVVQGALVLVRPDVTQLVRQELIDVRSHVLVKVTHQSYWRIPHRSRHQSPSHRQSRPQSSPAGGYSHRNRPAQAIIPFAVRDLVGTVSQTVVSHSRCSGRTKGETGRRIDLRVVASAKIQGP